MGKEKTVAPIEQTKTSRSAHPLRGALLACLVSAPIWPLLGCEVDSFFDPSKTGYFETTATTVPILERLDVIERGTEQWEGAEYPTRADLLPSQLQYRLAPGDVLDVELWELYDSRVAVRIQARIDQSGNIRLPMPLRDVPAAGLTLQDLEEEIIQRLEADLVRDPLVNLSLLQGSGFYFTVTGLMPAPGLFPLNRPDLRLADALAIAGGVPQVVRDIYVVREVPLSSEYDPTYRDRTPVRPPAPDDRDNIEDLIDQLDRGRGQRGNGTQPGSRPHEGVELVDVDAFQPQRLTTQPMLDVDDFVASTRSIQPARMDSWVYMTEMGRWVRRGQDPDDPRIDVDDLERPVAERLVTERIIRIPADRINSDSRFNIIVRPNDRIVVEPPVTGVVYIGGEVARPGVYALPSNGRLTLDTLVTAAGGPGPIAILDRVDFTRRLPDNRQATLRVNLRAIRHRTEPDIYIKPDDHIIVGTNWVATPLAVIRNGFRATYGFGFLLDRNFGNDVFGAPPSNNRFD